MNRLTTFQKEFSVDGFGDASSFRFLASQFPNKTYKAKCNSCEYYRRGRCVSNNCIYERETAYINFYII
ncbi:MAG: hypothetical protein GTN36_00070 [Candidatus Aenigmarchaeota archaeon]|nr:hypothetical protein [Candidatus Aenigmarchaeota archaeon]